MSPRNPHDTFRIDVRRRRAELLVHALSEILMPYLAKTDRYHAIARMIDRLAELGVEVMTDEVRAAAGLPPRGLDGWTDAELVALEAHRLAVLSRMIVPERFEVVAKVKADEVTERTSTGDIKYPEDIWKAARSIAAGYNQAMAISALILAERQRSAV